MKSINISEVKLYLYDSWAMALAEFAGKVLEDEGLPVELKGALIELSEALSEAEQSTDHGGW
jgi:hypothetical protein